MFTFATELARVIEALRARYTVRIVGVHGSGRSELVKRAVRALEDTGFTVVTLEADRSSTQPGAAVSRLARTLGVASLRNGDPLDLLSPAIAEGTVLAIDDVHLIDEMSLRILEALRRRTGAVFLLAELPGMGLHHPERTVSPSWPETIVRMRGIDMPSTSELIAEELGGEVEPAVVSRVFVKSGGLPLLSRAMVASARDHGLLVQRNGVWRQAGVTLWNEDLISLVDGLLAGYEPEVCALVRFVAELGEVTLEIATERLDLDLDLAQRACDYELLRLAQTGLGNVLHVWPRAFADRYQRSGVSLSTAWRNQTRVPAFSGALQFEGASLASLSHLFQEHESRAVAAAFTAWEAHPSLMTATAYLVGVVGASGERERIHRVLTETVVEAEDDSQASLEFVLQQAAWLAFETQEEADCRDLLESFGELHPTWRSAACAAGRLLSLLVGSGVETPPFEDEAEPTGLVAMERAARALVQGRVNEARRLSSRDVPGQQASTVMTGVQAMADLLDGQASATLAKAEKLMSHGEYHKLRRTYITGSYLAAVANYELGRRQAFLRVLNSIVLIGRPQYLFQPFYAALIQLHALDLGGEMPMSLRTALLRESARLQPRPGPFFGMGVDFATTLFGQRQSPLAFDQQMAASAKQRRELGYLVAAAQQALYALMFNYGPNTALEFQRAVHGIQAPGMEHSNRLIDLVRSETIDGFTGWADKVRKTPYSASHIRLLLAAARAETDPHRKERMEGIAHKLGSDRLLAEWSSLAESDDQTRFEQAPSSPLTQREREIALLAGRLSNVKIGERLTLSPRTVENHVARAMRKVGVANRHDLFEAVSAHSTEL